MLDCRKLRERLAIKFNLNGGIDCWKFKSERQKKSRCTIFSHHISQVQLLNYCALLCFAGNICVFPHFLFLFPPGQSHLPTFTPLPSLYPCVSQCSCHKNELNLSPSLQTTIDRVGTFRKTNHHPLFPLGIECLWVYCLCTCACVLLMRLKGQVRNRPMPKRYPGSFINMSSSQCLLNQQEIETNDVNNNK